MTPPTNITLSKNKKLLTVSFEESDFELSSEYLRVYSPSAEVRGHGPGQETLQLNKQDVTISSLVPMGNYAIAIHFSDGLDITDSKVLFSFTSTTTQVILLKLPLKSRYWMYF